MIATLPLFPLSTVLLPGGSLPLHVFEPRYRQLTVDLINEVLPDRRFGVITIKQGWEVGEDNVDAMYEVGCSARLQQVRQLPEGRYDLTCDGEKRFRLLQIDREAAPYLMARVEWIPDTEPGDDSAQLQERLADSARSAHERYRGLGLRDEQPEAPAQDVESGQLAYALAEASVLTPEDRQTLLAEPDPLARLRLIRTFLARETEFLRELRAVPAPLLEFAEETSVN